MAQRLAAKVVTVTQGFELHITGERARHIDGRVLEACANVALNCADAYGCLHDGVKLSEKCFEMLAGHQAEAGCFTKGLGLPPDEGRGRLSARLIASNEGVALHIGGTRARLVDAKVFEGCMNSLLVCADAHGCLNKGLALTKNCAEAVAGHHAESQCLAKGIGFASA